MPVTQGWKDIIRHIIIMIEQCSRNQRPRLPLSRHPRRRPSGEDGPHHARVLTTSRLSKLGGSRQDSDCDLSRQFPPARAGRLTRPSQKRPRPGYTPATYPVPGDGKRVHRAPGKTGRQLPIRAWAGSYTPHRRAHCAYAVPTEWNQRMARPPTLTSDDLPDQRRGKPRGDVTAATRR
jgi:hypothetical protein